MKKLIYLILFTVVFSFSLRAQSPYGKILTLDNNGAQQWIDIVTVLSNYINYHAEISSPTWLTNGNAITSGVFLGTTNNHPLIFKTNNVEHMRLLENGGLRLYTSTGANNITFQYSGSTDLTFNLPNSYGTSGQFLTTDGSGNLSWASASGSSGWSLTGNSGTNVSTNFIGTTDDQPLVIRVNNQETFRFNTTGTGLSAPDWSIQRGGGDTRGLHAVDLQSSRTATTQVASGNYSVISGGQNNTASGLWSTVGGGDQNNAVSIASTVAGGSMNDASGNGSTVGGGGGNSASGNGSTVGGGDQNTASGNGSTVGGGDHNSASGPYSTVGGGKSNATTGYYSAIPGGYNLKVGERSFGYSGQTSGTQTDLSANSNIASFVDVDMWLYNVRNQASQLRFYEPSGSGTNYTAFQSQAQSSDIVYTLPSNAGSSGQVLATDGIGNLFWASASGSSGWGLTGNAGTNPSINFIGTTDAAALQIKVYNQKSGRIDYTNPYNTAWGYQTLVNNTSGIANTASGYQALYSNTTGYYNTANGYQALYYNTSGDMNTASGYQALNSNTDGDKNTASGAEALYSNTIGSWNTASGYKALTNNTEGNENTASGAGALFYNTTGSYNTASGYQALNSNTTGSRNTANGYQALNSNTGGYNNTAVGYSAGSSITTGSNNICIGYNAQPSSATVSNEVTIGNSSNNSYRMYAASWTNASDARYKHDIEQLPFGLDFILQLKPRQYVYNNSTDGKITMGFVAQEVQEVMRQFGMVDKFNLVKPLEKDFLGLNTTEIIPILVKAVQEQQQTIEKMRNENEQMQAQNEQMRAENDALKQRLERLEKYVFERTGSGDNNVGMK